MQLSASRSVGLSLSPARPGCPSPDSPKRRRSTAPRAPPATPGRRGRGRVRGARRARGPGPVRDLGRSRAPHGARDSARDLVPRAAAPRRRACGAGARSGRSHHPCPAPSSKPSTPAHRRSQRVSETWSPVSGAKAAVWTTPARCGEPRPCPELRKSRLDVNRGPRGARCPKGGIRTTILQQRKDSPSAGHLDLCDVLEKGEALR